MPRNADVSFDLLAWAFRCYTENVVETPEQVGEALRLYLPEADADAVAEVLRTATDPGGRS